MDPKIPAWLLIMNMLWDVLKELFSPMLRELLEHLQVIVAVIPQASWDISNENGSTNLVKAPISQSAAIVIMNISSNPIKISDIGVQFKNRKELKLTDFNLPVKIEERDRRIFALKPETFEILKDCGLENIKYVYVETPLFRRFKTRLSKEDIEGLLETYYLAQGPVSNLA